MPLGLPTAILPTFPVNQHVEHPTIIWVLYLPQTQLSKTIWRWDRVTGIFKVPHEILMSAKLMNYVFENPMPK